MRPLRALALVAASVLALSSCSVKPQESPNAAARGSGSGDTAVPTDGFDAGANAPSKAKFDTTVRPILRTHCAACHESRIRPYHASASLDVAYQEVMTFRLVDFANVKSSRLYLRLAVDNHNCWGGDCAASSQTMLNALTDWASSSSNQGANPDGRSEGPPAVVPSGVTTGSPSDVKLNPNATDLQFAMASTKDGPVVFSVKVEQFDKYSYRVFWPRVTAPVGAKLVVKNLLFKVNDILRLDGSFSQLDKTIDGQGPTSPVTLDATTTLILLMENGPGKDWIAPSFSVFTAQ